MTLQEIAHQRIVAQQLLGTSFTKASEMVSWFAAVQAQEYGPTKLGLGLRLPKLLDTDIEHEFNTGRILRTHLLRPTWHFVNADDIHWLLQLTASRVHAANAYMYRKMELDESIFNRCAKILVQHLEGKKQLTREKLNEAFKEKKILAEGHRLSYIMMWAELEGILCSGAREGHQFTYALLEEQIPRTKTFNRDEALGELTLRYFKSRGPATVKDFSTWSGLTLTEAKKGIEMSNQFLTKEIIAQETYFFLSDSKNKKRAEKLLLLPIYDELIMGYKDRAPMMVYKKSLSSSPALPFDNMIVSGGQIIGTWKRTLKNSSIHLETQFFAPLNQTGKNALEEAVLRYQEFMGVKVVF